MSEKSTGAAAVRIRPLPLRGVLSVGRAADIWHKAALSAPIAFGVPALVLLALGRLDLALYTSAGSLCAIYSHGEPYASRARFMAWVVLGMLASVGIALVTAAATDSTAIRVGVAALLAAAHKALCDAARTGPPGGLILTFITASCLFVPHQRLADVPFHLALGLAGGAVAWLVVMAPALVRPDGPERTAVARALEAAARLAAVEPGATARVRHDAAAAINAAWHTLLWVGARTPARAANRRALERLVAHVGTVVAGAPDDPDRLAGWAADLRRNRPVPRPPARPGEEDELAGIAAERAAAAPRGIRGVLEALGPGSPLLPIAARVAVGAALAGWASAALGVGRPYWAVVTAAAVFQANITLSWRRGLQRAVGNLAGLALFTVLLPTTRIGGLALVAAVMALQFCTEATMARNYWLGSVFVTPMALLMVELAALQSAGRLAAERWLDTCVGVVAGLLSCALVTNRRATGRIGAALDRLDAATAAARSTDAATVDPPQIARARERLTSALVELRDAVDVASGEWWQEALPEERVERAEREAHRALAALAPARAVASRAA
ncbi:FUSC family protein [Actinomadura opuntiae]|uniref:FUSC family protein n=1 Tax=Actinomadura sp. OS1-43 TaxID=604315 RepID=UPI00255B408E|nr:FUSC family protein [Actinomadura sp. OS1-43]MDL4812998.1 FUSC family protein [Actinomadura sp. OS1-43]